METRSVRVKVDEAWSESIDELGEVHHEPLGFLLHTISDLISTEANKCILHTENT